MSRPALNFLRPYLQQASRPLRPEHARAYLALQKCFTHSVAAGAYTGPYDVEKQKRLEHLAKVKPLGEYHPRASLLPNVHNLSIRDFNAKYDDIQQTGTDVVSVFGRAHHP